MKLKLWALIMLDILLLSFLFFASSTDWLFVEQTQTSYKVSILMEDTDTSSDYFVAGVQQGAIEHNVDVHILEFTSEQTLEERKELLQKQLEKGTQGLVLCMHENSQMADLLSETPLAIPVVSWGLERNFDNVYANVGYDISMEVDLLYDVWIPSEKREISYVTLEDAEPKDDVFYEELKQRAEIEGFVLEEVKLAELSGARTFIQGMAAENKRIVVTTDELLLEAMGNAVKEMKLNIPLYGSGYSDGVRSALEAGAINGIVVHREFEGGYVAISQVVGALQQKISTKEAILVESALITKDNMYGTAEETFIFPYK
ncbi:hypothetical protein [Chakrabartyella piscis]|uniref:hypothetical protein n=1 Tax=Chakrabartyella piscis TaxID=2918914 RepID=UPI0029584D9D|nr:hypothetical protein [Chakrabartyella piscis]